MAGRFFSRLWQRREPQRPDGKDALPALLPLDQPSGTLSTAANVAPHPWPRLSESLAGPRQPGTCQSCGAVNAQLVPTPELADGIDPEIAQLVRAMEAGKRGVRVWQECDDDDHSEPIAVLLCSRCSARLIKPHPRLYYGLAFNEPFPGTMDICAGCRFGDGLRCTHPDRKANGGLGLVIEIDGPALLCGRGGVGGGTVYPRSATGCAGRELRDEYTRLCE